MAEWNRLVTTTISDYMKGVEGRLTSNQKLLASLKRTGRIKYNCSGLDFKWQVPYRQAPLRTTTGEDQIVPSKQDRFKQPSLDIGGYYVEDMMTVREVLKNGGGPTQLIDYYDQMAPRLGDDIEEQFGKELYVDSSATGNSDRITGFESMFGTNGTTTISSGAQRSANAADVVGYPSDTYAGISTALGQSGTWGTQDGIATTWPAGFGSLSYDFFSPVVVCYNSTAFNGTADTFLAQGIEALQFGIIHMQRYEAGTKGMKVISLDRELYRQARHQQLNKEQIIVSKGENSLWAFGFKDQFMLDGCEVTWEYGVPGAVGYGMNIENMELRSFQSRLFKVDGPTENKLGQNYYTLVRFFGNLKFKNPNRFAKFIAIAA